MNNEPVLHESTDQEHLFKRFQKPRNKCTILNSHGPLGQKQDGKLSRTFNSRKQNIFKTFLMTNAFGMLKEKRISVPAPKTLKHLKDKFE